MAKEKFLIIVREMIPDMFSRFSETANCARIDAGEESSDPYAWIEASFEVLLIRHREATHICSFTPSAYAIWLANEFVGQPNEAWESDGDQDGLMLESGQEEPGNYIEYRGEYDSRFICETFTIDTMRHLSSPMRKPHDASSARGERYHEAIWACAEETSREMLCNGVASQAPILDVYAYRQWRRELALKVRERAAELSRIRFKQGIL